MFGNEIFERRMQSWTAKYRTSQQFIKLQLGIFSPQEMLQIIFVTDMATRAMRF